MNVDVFPAIDLHARVGDLEPICGGVFDTSDAAVCISGKCLKVSLGVSC